MKKRRKGLKILGIVAGALVVLVAGMFVYFSIGLDEVKRMAIENVDASRIPDVDAPAFMDAQKTGELVARVIARQTPQVDAVSGATASSKAFLKAVENALKSA